MISTFLADNIVAARIALLVVAVLSAIGVVLFTVSPDPASAGDVRVCNLQPYAFPFDVFNIGLFFVPALFATVALRRTLPALLVAAAFSAAIELTQFLLPAIGRRCDIDDWLANVIGALLGVIVGWLTLRGTGRSGPAQRRA